MAEPATGALTVETRDDGSVFVEDTRRTTCTSPRTALLRGWKAAVFLACDRTQSFRKLAELPAVRRACVSEEDLAAFLGRCADNRLVLRGEHSWLSVAVHTPSREELYGEAEVRRRATVSLSA
jgi:hypothetical protein